MGKQEENSKKQRRKENIQKIILESVKAAGVLSVALVAPNALWSLKKMGVDLNKRHTEVVKVSRDRLVKNGLLEFNNGHLRLTKEGKARIVKYEIDDFKIQKPKTWDKKWRVLIFDIPEKRRRVRTSIRATLKRVGFMRLQDSAWVYPYDCEDLIVLLKAHLEIGRSLLYMIVDSIEFDQPIRKHFGLPLED